VFIRARALYIYRPNDYSSFVARMLSVRETVLWFARFNLIVCLRQNAPSAGWRIPTPMSATVLTCPPWTRPTARRNAWWTRHATESTGIRTNPSVVNAGCRDPGRGAAAEDKHTAAHITNLSGALPVQVRIHLNIEDAPADATIDPRRPSIQQFRCPWVHTQPVSRCNVSSETTKKYKCGRQ
jgi:predicted RNA-binding Zn-ribbon protein involved in translation (DUF1610 family)